MAKHEIVCVTPRTFFDIEIKIQGMENIHLSLYIDEDGEVQPVEKPDMALIWQLKLMDEEFWKKIKKTIKLSQK